MHRLPLAHEGEPPAPHDLWAAWNADPWLLLPLLLAVLLYARGVHNLWGRAGLGRGIRLRRVACFAGGILALLLALVSPLDALSGSLFSAHMVQHLVLILAAAPLLLLGEFELAVLWALPRRWTQSLGQAWNRTPSSITRTWQMLSRPVAAWHLFALAMWTWHAPALFEAGLQNEAVHTLEHAVFLGTALLFWWVLFRHTRQDHIRYGIAIPYLFTTVLHSGVLGALITFSTEPWYPHYKTLVAAWGLTPLEDQQLAGLIMWIPAGMVFSLLTIAYFAAWLRALDRHSSHLPQSDGVHAPQDPRS